VSLWEWWWDAPTTAHDGAMMEVLLVVLVH